MHWYLAAFKKYAIFRGRARRREYWTFQLVNLTVFFLLPLINNYAEYLFAAVILLPSFAVTVRRLHDTGKSGWWCLLSCYFSLAFKRLSLSLDYLFELFDLAHNYNVPVPVVPIIFKLILSICVPLGLFILFIIWTLQNSQPGANKYGENPKGIDI